MENGLRACLVYERVTVVTEHERVECRVQAFGVKGREKHKWCVYEERE